MTSSSNSSSETGELVPDFLKDFEHLGPNRIHVELQLLAPRDEANIVGLGVSAERPELDLISIWDADAITRTRWLRRFLERFLNGLDLGPDVGELIGDLLDQMMSIAIGQPM